MRLILSRKGFDSSAGGVPSPIIAGRPVSLPIPEYPASPTTYGQLGLGDIVSHLTKGRLSANDSCHDDPMFADGYCWFGQSGSAQGHLRNQGVTTGDLFLFFGLFADPESGEPHHRIFGYMKIACHGSPETVRKTRQWREPPRPHPHLTDRQRPQNSLYFGPGKTATRASPALRLTRPNGPTSRWIVPQWLRELGLTYHADKARWAREGELDCVRRGQEFVCHIGTHRAAREWVRKIIREIER